MTAGQDTNFSAESDSSCSRQHQAQEDIAAQLAYEKAVRLLSCSALHVLESYATWRTSTRGRTRFLFRPHSQASARSLQTYLQSLLDPYTDMLRSVSLGVGLNAHTILAPIQLRGFDAVMARRLTMLQSAMHRLGSGRDRELHLLRNCLGRLVAAIGAFCSAKSCLTFRHGSAFRPRLATIQEGDESRHLPLHPPQRSLPEQRGAAQGQALEQKSTMPHHCTALKQALNNNQSHKVQTETLPLVHEHTAGVGCGAYVVISHGGSSTLKAAVAC